VKIQFGDLVVVSILRLSIHLKKTRNIGITQLKRFVPHLVAMYIKLIKLGVTNTSIYLIAMKPVALVVFSLMI